MIRFYREGTSWYRIGCKLFVLETHYKSLAGKDLDMHTLMIKNDVLRFLYCAKILQRHFLFFAFEVDFHSIEIILIKLATYDYYEMQMCMPYFVMRPIQGFQS